MAQKSKTAPPKVSQAIRALFPLASTFDQVAEAVAITRACRTGGESTFHTPRFCFWRVKALDITRDDGQQFGSSQPVSTTRFWVFQDAPQPNHERSRLSLPESRRSPRHNDKLRTFFSRKYRDLAKTNLAQ